MGCGETEWDAGKQNGMRGNIKTKIININMKKNQLLFLVAIATFILGSSLLAQPTIIFTPSVGDTLRRVDVNATLEANGLTRDCEFHAIIEDATTIAQGNMFYGVFMDCSNLLSV